MIKRVFGCLGMTVAVLIVGSCQWQGMQAKQRIRVRFPAEYQDGQFAFYRASFNCPGYSYIFKLSPTAARKLRNTAQRHRTDFHAVAFWGTEGAAGLRCLTGSPYRDKPNNLKDHMNLPDTFLSQPRDDTYDYYIPSLGVIAGGNEPG